MALERTFMLGRGAARDAAFDGVFLTCVKTTGIYCLPSCKARSPRPENVEHARSPEEARRRGFRPCKRCRPDDFSHGFDRDLDALLTALAAARARPGDFADVAALAAAAGCGSTKLLTLCRRHLHRTPKDLLLEARLERARTALLTTDQRLLDVALDAGFESSSAFHANFRARFGLTPSSCRALPGGSTFSLLLPRPHPTARAFGWQLRGPAGLAERGDAWRWHKALLLDGEPHVLELRRGRGRVQVTVARPGRRAPGRPAMIAAHDAVVRMLRLDCDTTAAERVLTRSAALRPLVAAARGLRPWATATPFEALLFAILGQQVHLAFAHQLRDAVIRRSGRPAGDLIAHPDAAAVARLDERDLVADKCTRGKAAALLGAARAASTGAIDLDAMARGAFSTAVHQLEQLRGVGPWTSHYVAMRGLGFLDCAPVGDVVLQQTAARVFALPDRPTPAAFGALAAPFAPHRSLLTFHLWRLASDDAAAQETRHEHRPRSVRRPVRQAAGRG